MMWPGLNVVINDNTAKYIQYYTTSDELSWKKRVDILLEWITNPSAPANCIFAYFDEPGMKFFCSIYHIFC